MQKGHKLVAEWDMLKNLNRRFENKTSNCSEMHTEVVHCKIGKTEFENGVCRIQLQIRTAKVADKLMVALDFAISVMNANQNSFTDTVYGNTL